MELPVYQGIKLVAGHLGLHRDVLWAHVVDVPDALNWVRKGDLLLTTGVSWSHDPQWQVELVTSLHDKGVSGLVLATGRYFHEVPRVVRAMADRLHLPVFDAPFHVPFVEIVEAVGRAVAQEQAHLLQQSETIHRSLTAAALHTDTLTDLLQILARLIGKRVVIENTQRQVLAFASPSEEGNGVLDSTPTGNGDPRLQWTAHAELPAGWERITRAITVGSEDGSGRGSCIVCPIRVGTELQGLLWVLEDDEPLSELDIRAAEHGATVAALHLLRHQSISRVNRTIRSTFLDTLLTSDRPSTHVLEQAQILNFDLERHYMTGIAILVRPDETTHFWPLQTVDDFLNRERLGQLITDWLKQHGHEPLTTHLMNQVAFPVPVESRQEAKTVIDGLWRTLNTSECKDVLLTFGSIDYGASGIRESYREARTTACLVAPTPRVVWYDDYKLAQLITSIPRNELEAWVARCLEPVLSGKAPEQYMETLKALVECGFNQNKAAESLFIHINTLRYRVRKIEELFGRSLQDVNVQQELFLVFAAHKVLSTEP